MFHEAAISAVSSVYKMNNKDRGLMLVERNILYVAEMWRSLLSGI